MFISVVQMCSKLSYTCTCSYSVSYIYTSESDRQCTQNVQIAAHVYPIQGSKPILWQMSLSRQTCQLVHHSGDDVVN